MHLCLRQHTSSHASLDPTKGMPPPCNSLSLSSGWPSHYRPTNNPNSQPVALPHSHRDDHTIPCMTAATGDPCISAARFLELCHPSELHARAGPHRQWHMHNSCSMCYRHSDLPTNNGMPEGTRSAYLGPTGLSSLALRACFSNGSRLHCTTQVSCQNGEHVLALRHAIQVNIRN